MTCPLCAQSCDGKHGLGVHLRKAHGVLGRNAAGGTRTTCRGCGATVLYGNVARHERRCPAIEHTPIALPTPYGPAMTPDHSFRDELVAALEAA